MKDKKSDTVYDSASKLFKTKQQMVGPTLYMSPDAYQLFKEKYEKLRPTPKEAIENFKQELFKSLRIPQFVDWLSRKLKN